MSHIINPFRFASSFSPSDISGLNLWLAADAITGLSDGDTISTWEDQSASNWDATASGSGQPTYETNEKNGLPVVRFDGTDDFLSLTTSAQSTFTIFILFKGSGMLLGGSGVSVNYYVWPRSNPDYQAYFGSGYPAGSRNTTDWGICRLTCDGTTWTCHEDSTLQITETNSNDFQLGYIGRYSGGVYLTGDIAEVIGYDTSLGGSDISSVETYLTDKYAL